MPSPRDFFAGLNQAKGYIGFIALCVGIIGGHIRSMENQRTENLLLRQDIAHWQSEEAKAKLAVATLIDQRFEDLKHDLEEGRTEAREYTAAVERTLIATDANLSALLVTGSDGHEASNRLVAGRVAVLQGDVAELQQGLRDGLAAHQDSLVALSVSLSQINTSLQALNTWLASDTLDNGPGFFRRSLGVLPLVGSGNSP